MLFQVIHCPNCHGSDLVKFGRTRQGKQCFQCRGSICDGRTFILEHSYPGRSSQVKQQIVDMAMNGSGIRDTARVLHVSPSTVINELKKRTITATSKLVSIKATQSTQYRTKT